MALKFPNRAKKLKKFNEEQRVTYIWTHHSEIALKYCFIKAGKQQEKKTDHVQGNSNMIND